MPTTREASAMAVTLVDKALTQVHNGARWGQKKQEPRWDVLEYATRHDLLAYIGQLEMRCEEMAQKLAPRIPSLVEWR